MYSAALNLICLFSFSASSLTRRKSVLKVTVSLMTQLFAFLLSTAHCGSKL